MTEQTQPPAGSVTETSPPATEPQGVQLTPEQQSVLKEHGIDVPADGKINVGDHVKLLSTLAANKQALKQATAAQEQARLAGLDEASRKLEEAKAAGRAEAETAYKLELAKAQVKAAAAAKGFNDPADAHSMIPDLSALEAEADIMAAVEKLAADKPYLVKQAPKAPKLEGGPQGGGKDSVASDGNTWLRQQLTGGGR